MVLWIAICILNIIVAVFASLAGALLILTLPLEVTDIRYRQAHPIYARWASYTHARAFPKPMQTELPCHSSLNFWSLMGYSGYDFNSIFYILPFLVPALTAIVNGIVIGMVLT